jgi:hypothetical protein
MTVPQVLAALDAQSVLSAGFAAQIAPLVAARGLRYVAYEGGQALYGQSGWENDATLAALIAAANRDPGMRQVYVDHLTRWQDAGGGLFLAFVHAGRCTGGGCWGLLETQQQNPLTAPKWLGLMDWLALP